MISNSSANSTPVVSPQVPIVNANPPKQVSRRNMLLLFVLLIVSISVVAIGAFLLRNFQSQKSENTTTSSSQTPPVNLKAQYQNPFDKSTQYENPFENLK